MIAIYTQNRQAVWNFADISRFHVTGNGTGIQAVAKNGAGGELARYKNREQCTYVLEMLMSAIDADERIFIFPAERSLNMRNNTAQQEEVRGMAVLDHVPEGWKVVGGCTNAPAGYRFINNNKSRSGGEYQHALVKEDVAIEWWIDNT